MVKRQPRLGAVATLNDANRLGDPLGRWARERHEAFTSPLPRTVAGTLAHASALNDADDELRSGEVGLCRVRSRRKTPYGSLAAHERHARHESTCR